MASRNSRSLQGRERYLHHRDRDDRLFHRHLLDDYFEPERTRRPPPRFVPVRRRAEFVPTTVAVLENADVSTQRQLTLPLDGPPAGTLANRIETSSTSRTVDQTHPVAATSSTFRHDTGDSRNTPRSTDQAIRFPRRAAVPRSPEGASVPTLKPLSVFRKQKPPFTWRGFLTGCAMGSMAAAVALLVLHTITG